MIEGFFQCKLVVSTSIFGDENMFDASIYINIYLIYNVMFYFVLCIKLHYLKCSFVKFSSNQLLRLRTFCTFDIARIGICT